MLAVIEKVEGGHIARYNRSLNHSVEKVWAAITQNDKLGKWMPNLQVVDLKQGGTIKFNMNDGTGNSFDIKIRDFKKNEVLEYEWGDDGWVRFELYPKAGGCLLVLKEFISTINDHTSKDLAGWHVCLDVLIDLLNGRYHEKFPKENWKKWHQKYIVSIEELNH
ncbi:SRPBCC family protein [Halobacillus sp. BAB-2008]|uniref:SRPBCC family protein n=1 Tax=Halobacillus sp. BAB-2008 TaxID=1246484 RepID=UPI0002A510D7|nr:SRPBCC family protein [Halobacillus sp. BAB-2008]ELK47704.1 activator of Hsp90 ATPase 1 family protein [Halobacillus sp. BAB-2008]